MQQPLQDPSAFLLLPFVGQVDIDDSPLQSLIMASSAAVYVVDAEERVRLWNPAAEAIFGWRAADVLGQRAPGPPLGSPAEARALVRSALLGEPVTERRIRGWRRDGVPVAVTVSATRLSDPAGRPQGVMVMAEAAHRSERPLLWAYRELLKRERAAREQAEAAERRAVEAVQARERLLAVVSHDLRNSLATVLLNASALLEGPARPALGPLRDPVEWIARSAEQMNRLINDLLDVSAIERGRLSIEPGVHHPARLVEEAVAMALPLAATMRVRCEAEARRDLPPVWVDAGRIQQVLANLIGNAVKFSPAGGEIRVRAERHAAEQVRFSVHDRGPGIAPDHIHAVFDLYWQAGRRDRAGGGLGLAIARGIVDAHGGRIWVESEPGRGSTFYFTVPASDGVGPAAR